MGILAYKMIIGCILLIAGVVNTFYPAIYMSQLTVPRYKVLVESIEDVAANPDIKAFVTSGSPTANYVLVCARNIARIAIKFQSLFVKLVYRIRPRGLSISLESEFVSIQN